MSAFKNLMAELNSATPNTSTPRQTPATGSKPTQQAAGRDGNGGLQTPQLKRKASSPADGNQLKVQRKETPGQSGQTDGGGRPTPTSTPTPGTSRPATPSSTAVPYRSNVGSAASKPSNNIAKKPNTGTATQGSVPKTTVPAPKSTSTASASGTVQAQTKKSGYLAMLAKAKEKEQTKPVAAPVKHEPTKILKKKERLALRAEASAVAKGKKPAPGTLKGPDATGDSGKERRKPADLGYQGTARPAKKPVDIGYKGTAKPTTAAPAARNGTTSSKPKPKADNRYGGYASWSEDEEEEDEGEDDYASDGSSDMEGGMWDVEDEEQDSLKVAKKEDAEALAEEAMLKRQKEEKKRKLAALSKAAATKRRY